MKNRPEMPGRVRALRLGSAAAGIAAVLLNLLLPLAFAAPHTALAAGPFAAAICHGGRVASDNPRHNGDLPSLPHDGSDGTACCPIAPCPLARVPSAPAAVVQRFTTILDCRAGIGDETAPGAIAVAGFRSRAPPPQA